MLYNTYRVSYNKKNSKINQYVPVDILFYFISNQLNDIKFMWEEIGHGIPPSKTGGADATPQREEKRTDATPQREKKTDGDEYEWIVTLQLFNGRRQKINTRRRKIKKEATMEDNAGGE